MEAVLFILQSGFYVELAEEDSGGKFEEKEKPRIVNYWFFDFNFCSLTPKLEQYLTCCLCLS